MQREIMHFSRSSCRGSGTRLQGGAEISSLQLHESNVQDLNHYL